MASPTIRDLKKLIKKAEDEYGVTEDSSLYIDVYYCIVADDGDKEVVIDIDENTVFTR